MRRLLLALLTTSVVAVGGAILFSSLGIGGYAWYGLVLVSIIAGSLVDREHFYGAPRTG